MGLPRQLVGVFPYERLAIWQKAHLVTIGIYRLTAAYPRSEAFGLTSQLRRAAVSTSANIVEGSKRRSARSFASFINIAEGSTAEARYLLELATALGYGDTHETAQLLEEAEQLQRMLFAFRNRVARPSHTP